MNTNYIMGRNTLEEVLRHKPEILLEIYISITEKGAIRKDKLTEEIVKQKIPYLFLSKKELFSLVNSESHQSFVAKIKDRKFLDPKIFLQIKKERSIVLMVDNILDPHNMGAIFRSAECFGVDALIYSKNRGVDITPVVSKVSCGATELIPIIRVSNLAETTKEFKREGYELVIAENKENAVNLFEFDFSPKTLLIMGSEGQGVQRLLKELADKTIRIPLYGKIDSLNVSQATAVILSFIRKSKVSVC
jgi:23S rRNA (guanosine2251-2'-O)-methyltransferase